MKHEFVTEVKNLVKEQINNIHTALPGEFVSIDAATGLAQVRPKAQMKFSNGRILDFPIITGVPVVMLQSTKAGASICFPIKAGDQCLLIFSEQTLDSWLGIGNDTSHVKHGLSGAIAVPGLARAVSDDMKEAIESDSIIIRCNNSKITLSNDGIAIRGNVTVDGNLLINGEFSRRTGEI